MRKTVLLTFFTSVVAVLSAFSQPQITSISPASAEYGQTVTFTGSGFGATQGSSWALIGGSAADVLSWRDTQVVAKVGLFARNGSSTGIYNGAWGFVDFTVVNPHVTSVSISSGESDDQVTIDGTGFGATQGAGSAWLGNVRVVIISWSDTEIVGTIGSGASNVADGNNGVYKGGVWSNTISFSIVDPQIATFYPASAEYGQTVTFSGSGFGPAQGSSSAWLGNARANVVSWSDTQVVVTVPFQAQNVSGGNNGIYAGGIWAPVNFTIITPQITSISPPSAEYGQSVTFTGSGFGASQGSSSAWLGNASANVLSWSDTQIVATVPFQAHSISGGNNGVYVGGVWSNIGFNVVTPQIAGFTPSIALAGTSVTLTGTGFGASQGSGSA